MKYLGCEYMEHGLCFEYDKIHDCCIMKDRSHGMPVIFDHYNGESIDWEKIFEIKRNRIECQKAETIRECQGCYLLKDRNDSAEKYISHIMIQQIKLCNARCLYCCDEFRIHKKYYDVFPVLKDLVEKGYFRATNDGVVIFQGGEPTIMKNFDELRALFNEQNSNIKVNTSGICFNKTLAEAMKTGKILVCISLDCGCRKTYSKIKDVDKFDVVIDSVKKYSDAVRKSRNSKLLIKYLITPGYNDSVEEIDLFFDKMKKLKIKNIAFDIEAEYVEINKITDISPHIFYLLDYGNLLAEKEKMNVELYSFAFYILQERKIPYSQKLLYNKKLLIKTINELKEENKHKNFEYAIPTKYFID